jgi:hypothetical protein
MENSMEFNEIPWNSIEFSMEFHGIFHGIPLNLMKLRLMEFHGIQWNSIENSMEFNGIPWIFVN